MQSAQVPKADELTSTTVAAETTKELEQILRTRPMSAKYEGIRKTLTEKIGLNKRAIIVQSLCLRSCLSICSLGQCTGSKGVREGRLPGGARKFLQASERVARSRLR